MNDVKLDGQKIFMTSFDSIKILEYNSKYPASTFHIKLPDGAEVPLQNDVDEALLDKFCIMSTEQVNLVKTNFRKSNFYMTHNIIEIQGEV